ncbi:hypothetical protein ACHWQZ_G016741 [Mnemiopsis leidyi]
MTELHTADFLPAFDGLIPAFPAHSLTRKKQILTEGGAWLVEHQEAQHRRYHSFLLYDQDYIQHRQKEAEKDLGEKILDGYYLLNCAKLDDPQDICSVDISNQGLNAAKEDDFDLFINLFHINAAENNLKLECLSAFPMVREIQFQFNSLSKVKISPNHFLHLDTLDLSYNQISHSAILNIGLIERLRVLVLTANEIKTLPSNMAYPAVDNENQVYKRFANLEELYLDNNHLCDLSTFATLGALKKLKYLNLAKNHIYYIPHLRVLGSAIAHVEDFKAQSKSAKSGSIRNKSQRSSAQSQQKMKQDISNSEFGLTKSKITPINQTKTPKRLFDVAHTKDVLHSDDSPDVLEDDTTPDSEISTPEPEDMTPDIRDKKPKSRPDQEEMETGVSRADTPATPGKEPIIHVGSTSALPGGSVKSGMMERDISKSDSPDAIRKNKLDVDAYLISEGKSTAETMYQTAPMPLQQPFPQLQTLILSDNVISEEEGVLACALWPKLCQLVLHNNPVITQCRGLPILLTHELTLRNGITIIRNPPSKVKKPPSVTVSASSRRVKEPPRPLPRQPHPDLLALESAPALALPPSTPGSTIPPITPRTSAPEPATKDQADTEAPDEGVFLTQVDDQEAEQEGEGEEESEPDILSYTASTVNIPDKYKGFEDLVDVEDDPEDYIPEHIQSAVSSLRKALQKTMILPDIYKPVCNSEVLPRKHNYKSCKGQRLLPPAKKLDKDRPIADGLRLLKTQNVTQEGGLSNFMGSDNIRVKRQGKRLLTQIQRRYDKVRSECLQQRSSLLEDIRATDPSLKSSFTLEQMAPSLSILPPRTQASTYDSERVSNTPYTFREEDADDSISRESSQYTL